MKYLITITLCLSSFALFAQRKQNQFILIVRSKANVKATPELIKTNAAHWQEFMGDLGKSGKIVAGFRPGIEGLTLIGSKKISKQGAYAASGEVVSTFLVVNAANMNEAKLIAAKCPVYELQGNVEIRPIQNSVN
jgi:hypothetical protein